MMAVNVEDILDVYVSSNRDKIVLKAFDWETVKKYKAILFLELEDGHKQISSGQIFIPKEDIAELKHEIRWKLIEWMRDYSTGEYDANIFSADVLLLKEYESELLLTSGTSIYNEKDDNGFCGSVGMLWMGCN